MATTDRPHDKPITWPNDAKSNAFELGVGRPSPSGRLGGRVSDALGFVLHTVPWRETSLVVDLLTRDHGRIACVAKGAKRPHSALRGSLHAFQPLNVAFSGRQELRTLTAAHWLGGSPVPQGDGLLCAFYLNELLVRFLPRDDPHPILFDGYTEAIIALGLSAPLEATLRRFEWLLLRETGYGLDLQRDIRSQPITESGVYTMVPCRGFLAADGESSGTYRGRTLLDIANECYDSQRTLLEAKRLTRSLLNQHLSGQPLKTRQILLELHKL